MRTSTKWAVMVPLLSACYSVQAQSDRDIVRQQVLRDNPGAKIEEIRTITVDGRPALEVDYRINGSAMEAIYDSSGRLLSVAEDDFGGDTIILGIFTNTESNVYKDGDTEVDVFPYIYYDTGTFYIQGPNAGYRFYRGAVTLAAQLEVEIGEGYETDENDFVADMEELDTAVLAGLVISKSFGDWEAGASLQGDVSGAHDGYIAGLFVEKEYQLNSAWELEVGAGLNYYDSNYNDYYFGVDQRFARADRPAYEADADIGIEPEVGVSRRIGDNWFLRMQFEYEYLGGEATDSPLVDDNYSGSFSIGIGYGF